MFNFAVMKVDDLFVPDGRSSTDKLKTDADSLIEPVVESLKELDCLEFDTLMAISVCADRHIEHPYPYICSQASIFGRMILDQLNCITERSIMAVRTGIFDWFDVNRQSNIMYDDGSDSYNVVFLFKRNFKTVHEILQLLNVSYGHFCVGSHVRIEFHTMGSFGIMNEHPACVSYSMWHRDLYLRCKGKELKTNPMTVWKEEFPALVDIIYRLLPVNKNIQSYEKLCDYLRINMFETDAVGFLLEKRGLKDSQNPVMVFETGNGYLSEWDGRVPIDALCQDEDSQLILLTSKTEDFTHKVLASIAGTSNQIKSIRNFFRTAGSAYSDFKMEPSSKLWTTTQTIEMTDFAYVRQFNIYHVMFNEYAPLGTHTYFILFRMKPHMIDGVPGEVVLTAAFQMHEGGDGFFIRTGGYKSQGEMMRQRLASRLGIVLPDSFVREFDNNLERVQEQQLKDQIRYHGREH